MPFVICLALRGKELQVKCRDSPVKARYDRFHCCPQKQRPSDYAPKNPEQSDKAGVTTAVTPACVFLYRWIRDFGNQPFIKSSMTYISSFSKFCSLTHAFWYS